MSSSPQIALIDSGCANIASVNFALERLGHTPILTADEKVIKAADRVILPGVGAAPAAMKKLHERNLISVIKGLTQPVIGICLGMQLLFSHSEEFDTGLLDIIPAPVVKFSETIDIIPHMGWNNVSLKSQSPLLEGLSDNSYFYFVHSFYAALGDYTIGECDYGDHFSAIVNHKNFYGCQFHPEKSGDAGSIILKNFIEGDV